MSLRQQIERLETLLAGIEDVTNGNVLQADGSLWQSGTVTVPSTSNDLDDITSSGEQQYGGFLYDGSGYVHGTPQVLVYCASRTAAAQALTGSLAALAISESYDRNGHGSVSTNRVLFSSGTWTDIAGTDVIVTATATFEETAGASASGEFVLQHSANGTTWTTYSVTAGFSVGGNGVRTVTNFTIPITLGATNYFRAAARETAGALEFNDIVMYVHVVDDSASNF